MRLRDVQGRQDAQNVFVFCTTGKDMLVVNHSFSQFCDFKTKFQSEHQSPALHPFYFGKFSGLRHKIVAQ